MAASGPNACGREGVRRCSASCTWLDDDFYRAESASSCDYCDDSGMGLGEEIPFATEMRTITVDSAWTAYGNAQNCLLCVPSGWYIAVDPSDQGAVYADPIRLGFGPTYIQVVVATHATASNPDGSWSVIILAGTPAAWLGTGTSPFPHTAGLAVTWSFQSLSFPLRGPTDTLSLRELRPTGGARLIGSSIMNVRPPQDGPAGTEVRQTIWIEMIPDDPRTAAADESALAVIGPIGTGLECGAGTALGPCGIRFDPGLELHVGVLAAATPTSHAWVYSPAMQLTLNAACAVP